jgi:RNA polymerase sigma-70 factor (ECF subfamily)
MAFPLSDEALMREFQDGSRDAFDELFARYRAPLYGFFRRRLGPPAERSEDLTQETFLAVLHAVRRYEPRATVRTYLYAIALNLLASERRRRVHSPGEGSFGGNEPTSDFQPDNGLWVQQAMEKLDETEREILMLREFEELSYAEISRLLRIPVNTVRSRLFRARLALKAKLEVSHEN